MDTAQAGWGFIISIFLCFFLIEFSSDDAGLFWFLFALGAPLFSAYAFMFFFAEQYSKDRKQQEINRIQQERDRKMTQWYEDKRQERIKEM